MYLGRDIPYLKRENTVPKRFIQCSNHLLLGATLNGIFSNPVKNTTFERLDAARDLNVLS